MVKTLLQVLWSSTMANPLVVPEKMPNGDWREEGCCGGLLQPDRCAMMKRKRRTDVIVSHWFTHVYALLVRPARLILPAGLL
jgi:hypothetical protein